MVKRVEEEAASVRTVSKWLRCYRADVEDGLLDCSSAPHSIPHRTRGSSTGTGPSTVRNVFDVIPLGRFG